MNLNRLISQLINIPPEIAFKKSIGALTRRLKGLSSSILFDYEHNPDNLLVRSSYLFEFKKSEINEDYVENIILTADNSINGKTSILGHKNIDISIENDNLLNKLPVAAQELSGNYFDRISGKYSFVDWQKDSSSGYRWSAFDISDEIKYGNVNGADIKFPWEVGRQQDIVIVAIAYLYTNDEKYINHFKNRIFDFLASNPYGYGTQWMTSMEIGIRAVNFLIAYDILFTNKVKFDKDFEKTFGFMIETHKLHLINNPEWSDGMRGNHYFINLCSLIIIMVYQNDLYNIDEVLDKLMIELDHQFTSDGLNFEASSYYHAFITEVLLWTFLLLNSKKKHIYEEYLENIRKKLILAKEFVSRIMRDDGTLFQIGDNDGGSFIHLKEYSNKQDKSYLIELYNHISYREDFDYLQALNLKKINIKEEINSFFDNYYGILAQKDIYKLFLRTGEKGQMGKGGHAHCDLNSICLNIDGKPFVVDPGTFSYTGYQNERNLYRSSAMHNTLVLSDLEQYEIKEDSKDDLFWLYGKVKVLRKILNSSKFIGFHDAYGNEHSRYIECENSKIYIKDEMKNHDKKMILLHFSPEIDFIDNNGDSAKIYFNNFIVFIKFPEKNITIDEYDYSATYGMKQRAKKLIYTSNATHINWKIFINENSGTH